jgi:hypothetical protein
MRPCWIHSTSSTRPRHARRRDHGALGAADVGLSDPLETRETSMLTPWVRSAVGHGAAGCPVLSSYLAALAQARRNLPLQLPHGLG